MSYRDLEVWQLAGSIAVDVHKMRLTRLPMFERSEGGSQIRTSAQSIRSSIVEGYSRRRYKRDFIKPLVYALGSSDETIDHLESLFETGSLTDKVLFVDLHSRLDTLGRKLNKLIQGVEAHHRSPRSTTSGKAGGFPMMQ